MWVFCAKNISFLILKKFSMYPVMKGMISSLILVRKTFELKSPTLESVEQKVLNFVCSISVVLISDLTFVFKKLEIS